MEVDVGDSWGVGSGAAGAGGNGEGAEEGAEAGNSAAVSGGRWAGSLGSEEPVTASTD